MSSLSVQMTNAICLCPTYVSLSLSLCFFVCVSDCVCFFACGFVPLGVFVRNCFYVLVSFVFLFLCLCGFVVCLFIWHYFKGSAKENMLLSLPGAKTMKTRGLMVGTTYLQGFHKIHKI